MAVVNFEIFKILGTLSENKDGWKKQLTCTSWGRYNPKFDLRSWDTEYTGMTKGITMTLEEIMTLKELLNEVDLEAVLAEALEERAQAKVEAKALEAENAANGGAPVAEDGESAPEDAPKKKRGRPKKNK